MYTLRNWSTYRKRQRKRCPDQWQPCNSAGSRPVGRLPHVPVFVNARSFRKLVKLRFVSPRKASRFADRSGRHFRASKRTLDIQITRCQQQLGAYTFMAQTEITGEDQIANSVQTGSTALPHKAIPSESSAFTHSHTQETSHVFENGFEAAEPPVPSDPGNNSYPAPNPLTSQPELLGEDLMPQQNGIQSAMHEAEPVFESSTRTTADGNSANLSSEPEEPEAAPELPAKDMSLPVNRRMWFVRVPRPADDHTIKLLEREMESYKAQVRLLNESLAVKRVSIA